MTGELVVFDERRRAHRELEALVAEAIAGLTAVEAGDVAAIYSAQWATSKAVVLVLSNHLDAEGLAS